MTSAATGFSSKVPDLCVFLCVRYISDLQDENVVLIRDLAIFGMPFYCYCLWDIKKYYDLSIVDELFDRVRFELS